MQTYRLRTRTLPVPYPLQAWTAWVSSDGSEHEIQGPFPVLAIRTVEIEVEASLQPSELRHVEEDDAVESRLERRLHFMAGMDPQIYLLLQHDGTWESPWVPLASGDLPASAERAFLSYEAAERAVREELEDIARRSGRQGQ
ncbi:MAG: hypothetical protein RMK67_02560 [Chloroflexota bacterium]|nr:hypothetical protein [Chloroflexota bacterium]